MCAVTNMAVLFCMSLILCFPGMLLRYCRSDFERVPVAHIIIGITFDFTVHIHWLPTTRSLYLTTFSAYFLVKFLSPELATSIKMHIPLLLSRIMKSGLLLGIVLSVHTCRFHNVVNGHTKVRCLIWMQFPSCCGCCYDYYYYYYYYYYSVCTFTKCEKRLLPLSCVSPWNNSDPTAPISWNLKIWVSSKYHKNCMYFIWKPMYIYDKPTLNSSYNEKCLKQKL